MKSMQLLTKLQTFLSECLDVNLQRSIATDLEAHVLNLFHTVAESVPAYRHFLQVQGLGWIASIQQRYNSRSRSISLIFAIKSDINYLKIPS